MLRATVGWDRPLQTFFAQVIFATEDEPDEGEALIWVGTEPSEHQVAAKRALFGSAH